MEVELCTFKLDVLVLSQIFNGVISKLEKLFFDVWVLGKEGEEGLGEDVFGLALEVLPRSLENT